MNTLEIDKSVQAALVADSYLLGSHWIYEASELQNLSLNWNELNAPSAQWHKGKEKGDFTHYGDHAHFLNSFVQQTNDFKIQDYATQWLEMMKDYNGYVDGSCKNTLEVLQVNSTSTRCSTSSDLSIVGSIAPLLYISKTQDEFLKNVENFIAFTHNNERVLKVAEFFACILYEVIHGASIKKALSSIKIHPSLQEAFNLAKHSHNKPSVESIHTFGHGCPVDGGFESTLHLLFKYDDYKEAMIANAKSGGDSASRGMIVGMLMGANDCIVPQSWIDETKSV